METVTQAGATGRRRWLAAFSSRAPPRPAEKARDKSYRPRFRLSIELFPAQLRASSLSPLAFLYNVAAMHSDVRQSDLRHSGHTEPRATLHTIGCRLNQAESALLADRLRADGYRLVEFGQPTDLLVLNTCSVTEKAESDCRYLVRRTLRHSPHAFVAVTGCYAQTGAEALRHVPGIDLIVGAQYKMSLPDYLPAPPALRKQPAPQVLH